MPGCCTEATYITKVPHRQGTSGRAVRRYKQQGSCTEHCSCGSCKRKALDESGEVNNEQVEGSRVAWRPPPFRGDREHRASHRRQRKYHCGCQRKRLAVTMIMVRTSTGAAVERLQAAAPERRVAQLRRQRTCRAGRSRERSARHRRRSTVAASTNGILCMCTTANVYDAPAAPVSAARAAVADSASASDAASANFMRTAAAAAGATTLAPPQPTILAITDTTASTPAAAPELLLQLPCHFKFNPPLQLLHYCEPTCRILRRFTLPPPQALWRQCNPRVSGASGHGIQ
ncbi:hypothetical protein GGX14DRAFT_405389 [Mycena pura]|uniref:Uncharacterized protein n=1 Tax=Mycena pura TaxID=153505 RepID=A0AAD6USR3_9AGAR|nr:hypothetical protein GGX14DRAFT_405389 [Mycena pura]